MKRLVNFFAFIGKVSVVIFVLSIFGLFLNFLVMPAYTRQGKEVIVPDIRGMQIQDAEREMKASGFTIVVDDQRFDLQAAAGTILDQLPHAGAVTKKGRRIHVGVSTGYPYTTVPNLVGLSRDDARFHLQNSGLTVGKIRYAFSTQVFEGLILEQTPDSGFTIARNDSVDLVISLGKKPTRCITPELIGIPKDQAIYLLLKSGLEIGKITYDKYVGKVDGAVMFQSIIGGREVSEGTEVDLVINGEEPGAAKE